MRSFPPVLVFFTNTLAPGIGVTQLKFHFSTLRGSSAGRLCPIPPVLVFFTNTLALSIGVIQLMPHPISPSPEKYFPKIVAKLKI
jgi:hypothetical protein